MQVRGRAETWAALEDGNVTVSKCVACQQELYCVMDAMLVACPYCTIVSPVAEQTMGSHDEEIARSGVGVGLKMDAVAQWYSDRFSRGEQGRC